MGQEEGTFEKAKGMAKEAAGKMTGQDDVTREGEAQQKKAQQAEEAERAEDQAREKREQAAAHRAEQRANE